MCKYTVIPHRDVKKSHIPLLEKSGLHSNFQAIVNTLKINPFSNEHSMEKLHPKNKKMYSMRINNQHRVVYTVDKQNKVVKIWSAWTHYEN